MSASNLLVQAFQHFKLGLQTQRKAIDFIKEHRIWDGFWTYGWATRIFVILGLVVGFKFLSVIFSLVSSFGLEGPLSFTSNVGGLLQDVTSEGFGIFYVGGLKYFILILMEVLIFHFARKTLEITRKTEVDSSFKTFLKAEYRMIKVVIGAFFLEIAATIIMRIVFKIFDLEFLEYPLSFIIQCYFIGFVVIDNYNEIFGMTIRESERFTRQYLGLAVAIGLVTYLLLFIPILGAAIAPLLAGVSATLAMNELTKDIASHSTEAIKLEEVH